MESNNQGRFDETVSESKEASMAKALELLLDEIKNNQVVQTVTRPKVSVLKGIFFLIIYITSYIVLFIGIKHLTLPAFITVLTARIILTAVYVFIAIIFLKKFLLWLILLYQRFAPEKIRKQCCFQPSCSEYMKLAIHKYGVIRGIHKGCKRLLRCHWPNGGVDYP